MELYNVSVIFQSQITDSVEGLSGLDAAIQIHRWFAKPYDPPIRIESELVCYCEEAKRACVHAANTGCSITNEKECPAWQDSHSEKEYG